MTLTLNFQGQIWNLLYLSQKWSDCHGTKSKHIDWTPRPQCDHQVRPWPWPWPWIFKVKYGISYISAKSGPFATKRKANIISVELQASNVTNGFDLDHNLDLWNLKVKSDLDLWPYTWPWPWIFMVKFWNSCISEWEGRLTLINSLWPWSSDAIWCQRSWSILVQVMVCYLMVPSHYLNQWWLIISRDLWQSEDSIMV